MTLERGGATERTRRDKALTFYHTRATSHPMLWVFPQSTQEAIDWLTDLIPKHGAEAVEAGKFYGRVLQEKGITTQYGVYRIMYLLCERYALSLTLSTNTWKRDPVVIDQYEELARGFLELANEALENEAPE